MNALLDEDVLILITKNSDKAFVFVLVFISARTGVWGTCTTRGTLQAITLTNFYYRLLS